MAVEFFSGQSTRQLLKECLVGTDEQESTLNTVVFGIFALSTLLVIVSCEQKVDGRTTTGQQQQ
jgi:hypothetical protein